MRLRLADELSHGFSSIAGVQALRNGRILVVDDRERAVSVVDIASGQVTAAARAGSGPNEVRSVGALLCADAGAIVMFDEGNSRLLQWNSDGSIDRTIPIPTRLIGFLETLAWGDCHGALYGQLRTPFTTPTTLGDSAPVVRYRMATGILDTVTWVKVPRTDVVVIRHADGSGASRRSVVPFAPHDGWVARVDGAFVLVRGDRYQLHVSLNGRIIDGPARRLPVIAVTQADRDSVMARRRPSGQPGLLPEIVEPSVWYRTKPAFAEDCCVPGAGGETWVQVTRRSEDPYPAYDQFDAQGRWMRTVRLPVGSRLVAANGEYIFAVRTDSDGLQFIQRLTRP